VVFLFWSISSESAVLVEAGLVGDQKKLVLVTGANGFVGSHLTEALLAQEYRVRCMVRCTSDLTFIRHLPVEWAYADLRDSQGLRQACHGIDIVCHCAALTRALDEETFQRVNAQGPELLARVCLEESPKLSRFLFLSSHAAAGPSASVDEAVDESCPPRPVTWYGKSKLTAEQALMGLADQLPLTIVRPSAVFGPRDRDFFAYFALVKRGLELQLGRHERVVSLIYIRDLIDLLVLTLDSDAALGQIYFGCGQAYSYTELSEAIAVALNRRTWCVVVPEAVLAPLALWSRVQGRVLGRPALLNDQRIVDLRQRYWVCSGEKARQELAFTARCDLATAVRETANWYCENGWL
jgi:dihydroflavonol-4-reductase